MRFGVQGSGLIPPVIPHRCVARHGLLVVGRIPVRVVAAMVFGVWCLVFGVWCLGFGVFEVWCLVFGV